MELPTLSLFPNLLILTERRLRILLLPPPFPPSSFSPSPLNLLKNRRELPLSQLYISPLLPHKHCETVLFVAPYFFLFNIILYSPQDWRFAFLFHSSRWFFIIFEHNWRTPSLIIIFRVPRWWWTRSRAGLSLSAPWRRWSRTRRGRFSPISAQVDCTHLTCEVQQFFE